MFSGILPVSFLLCKECASTTVQAFSLTFKAPVRLTTEQDTQEEQAGGIPTSRSGVIRRDTGHEGSSSIFMGRRKWLRQE
jgi:hypothetical protein